SRTPRRRTRGETVLATAYKTRQVAPGHEGRNAMNSVIFRLLSLCSAIACALGLPGGASAQKLTRPEIKSISAPAYYPGGGIGFTATIADQLAYLNVEMMRVE